MDKEVVEYIHNEILLSCEKEYIWVSANEVGETGACSEQEPVQSEVKSEREIQILYNSAHVCNLERWPWWSYMQGSKKKNKKQM